MPNLPQDCCPPAVHHTRRLGAPIRVPDSAAAAAAEAAAAEAAAAAAAAPTHCFWLASAELLKALALASEGAAVPLRRALPPAGGTGALPYSLIFILAEAQHNTSANQQYSCNACNACPPSLHGRLHARVRHARMHRKRPFPAFAFLLLA